MLRSIENTMIDSSAQNWAQYFILDEYRDPSGKLNRQYLLTRDGFTLLVMGFTGQKALQWKLKYIQAFNAMEEALKGKGFKIEPVQLQCIKETNKTLKFIQDKNLRDSIARQALSRIYDIEIPQIDHNPQAAKCEHTVKEFITNQCSLQNESIIKLSILYLAYKSWCMVNKFTPVSKINFGRNLHLLGFDQGQNNQFRYWKGISLITV